MALISTSKILVGFHGPAYGTPAASVAQRNEWSGVTDGGIEGFTTETHVGEGRSGTSVLAWIELFEFSIFFDRIEVLEGFNV